MPIPDHNSLGIPYIFSFLSNKRVKAFDFWKLSASGTDFHPSTSGLGAITAQNWLNFTLVWTKQVELV